MAAGQGAQAAGERVEKLLAELQSHGGPQVAATAEELVGCLVELYGAGLAEIVRILGEDAQAGARLLDALAADPLVEGLLLVHDLHPVGIGTRVERALQAIMPKLGSHAGHAEFLGVDDQGVIRLRLERGGHGCNSSAAAYTTAIEQAVAEAAPEAAGVDIEVVEVPAELPLLQIGRGPAGTRRSR